MRDSRQFFSSSSQPFSSMSSELLVIGELGDTQSSGRTLPADDSHFCDAQLIVQGNKVTWSVPGRVHRSYTLQGDVLDAVWTRFPAPDGEGEVSCLCILQVSLLTVYAITGQVYTVALPCKRGKIWALSPGLLLQRVGSDGGADPVLFCLRHPLEEPKPIPFPETAVAPWLLGGGVAAAAAAAGNAINNNNNGGQDIAALSALERSMVGATVGVGNILASSSKNNNNRASNSSGSNSSTGGSFFRKAQKQQQQQQQQQTQQQQAQQVHDPMMDIDDDGDIPSALTSATPTTTTGAPLPAASSYRRLSSNQSVLMTPARDQRGGALSSSMNQSFLRATTSSPRQWIRDVSMDIVGLWPLNDIQTCWSARVDEVVEEMQRECEEYAAVAATFVDPNSSVLAGGATGGMGGGMGTGPMNTSSIIPLSARGGRRDSLTRRNSLEQQQSGRTPSPSTGPMPLFGSATAGRNNNLSSLPLPPPLLMPSSAAAAAHAQQQQQQQQQGNSSIIAQTPVAGPNPALNRSNSNCETEMSALLAPSSLQHHHHHHSVTAGAASEVSFAAINSSSNYGGVHTDHDSHSQSFSALMPQQPDDPHNCETTLLVNDQVNNTHNNAHLGAGGGLTNSAALNLEKSGPGSALVLVYRKGTGDHSLWLLSGAVNPERDAVGVSFVGAEGDMEWDSVQPSCELSVIEPSLAGCSGGDCASSAQLVSTGENSAVLYVCSQNTTRAFSINIQSNGRRGSAGEQGVEGRERRSSSDDAMMMLHGGNQQHQHQQQHQQHLGNPCSGLFRVQASFTLPARTVVPLIPPKNLADQAEHDGEVCAANNPSSSSFSSSSSPPTDADFDTAVPIVRPSVPIDPCNIPPPPPRTIDVLALHPDGSLAVYNGGLKLFAAHPHPLPPNAGGIIDIRHPVGDRVSVVAANGTVFRVFVPIQPSHPLIRCCMEELVHTLPPSLIHFIRSKVLSASLPPNAQWNLFSETLISLAMKRTTTGADSTSTAVVSPPTSAWQALLKSEFHNSMEARRLLCSSSLLPGDYAGLGGGQSFFTPKPKGATVNDDINVSDNDLARIILTLHCVYEDIKLNSLKRAHLSVLASLLVNLAYLCVCVDHVDHYLRDFHSLHLPSSAAPSVASHDISLLVGPVADVFAALAEKVKKGIINNTNGDGNANAAAAMFTVGGAKGVVPVLPGGRMMSLTRKVFMFYDILFEKKKNVVGQVLEAGQQDKSSSSAADVSFSRRTFPAPSSSSSGADPHSRLLSPPPPRVSSPLGIAIDSRPPSSFQRSPPRGRRESSKMDMNESSATSTSMVDLKDDDEENSPFYREEQLVLAMVEQGFKRQDVDALSYSIGLPLRDALARLRPAPPMSFPPAACRLVGREDRALPLLPRLSSPFNGNGTASAGVNEDGDAVENQGDDGTRMSDELSMLRFPKDRRLKEVARLLSSTRPVVVPPIDPAAVTSDHSSVLLLQQRLWALAQKTLAKPFGRGLFTLASASPLPTEPLPAPPLQLAGRVLPGGGLVRLDLGVVGQMIDVTLWPEFHNGVAAALRLAPGQAAITRTWIVYNRPPTPTHAHAGFLLGLGLQGHLQPLAIPDLFGYLSLDHDATKIAVLLGMSASKRGSMDPAVFKMLFVHLPGLHPASFPELDLSPPIQTAAMIGVGLLYQGSCKRRMSEFLVNEIGKRAVNDRLNDREASSLAAGLALGLVMLGHGSGGAAVTDLMLETKLLRLIDGGKLPNSSNSQSGDAAQCCRIKESTAINTDLSAPGATLALGLMFLRTNDISVANRLALPNSHYQLLGVRPDFLLLRVIARALIMWDDTKPTKEWLEGNIPPMVRRGIEILAEKQQSSLRAAAAALAAAKEKLKNEMNKKEGEEKQEKQQEKQQQQPPEISKDEYDVYFGDGSNVDWDSIRHAHENIRCGACLAMGLRFAGSGDRNAWQVVRGELDRWRQMLGSVGKYSLAKLERYLIESCIDTAATSLAMIMAGTGDVDTLRILRSLCIPLPDASELSYGNHMARSGAVGLLFLGGGRASLSASKEATAYLLIATYPRWPLTTNDNRYHLQALRHFAVLAAQHRCLETRDTETGAPCMVPVEIYTQAENGEGEEVSRATTPVLLPHIHLVRSIRVVGPRYWPISLSLTGEGGSDVASTLQKGAVLYVQRKTGHLPYLDDPMGRRGLLSRSFLTGQSADRSALIESFSADPKILAFAREMCQNDDDEVSSSQKLHPLDADLSASILFECMTRDKPEMLQSYIALALLPSQLAAGDGCAVRDLRFVFDYVDLVSSISSTSPSSSSADKKNNNNNSKNSLLSPSFVSSILMKTEETLGKLPNLKVALQALVHRCITASSPSAALPTAKKDGTNHDHALLGCLQILHNIPPPTAIGRASQIMRSQQVPPEFLIPLVALCQPHVDPRGLVAIAPFLKQ